MILNRARSTATLLRDLAAALPTLRGALDSAVADLDRVTHLADHAATTAAHAFKQLEAADQELKAKVEDARNVQATELGVVKQLVSEREDDVKSALGIAHSLRSELDRARDTIAELAAATAKQKETIRGLDIDCAVKRQALREGEDKINTIVAENRFLRRIAAHNDDLLREVESLRIDASNAEAEQKAAVQARDELAVAAARDRSSLGAQTARLRTLIDQQQEEMALLRRAANEAHAISATMRQQRDDMSVQFTPRPNLQEAIAAAGLASASEGGVGAVGRYRTNELVSILVDNVSSTTSQLRATKRANEVQRAALPMLEADDFEAVQFVSGGFRGGGAPVSSHCLVARGALPTVLPHLRHTGLLAVRSVMLPELVAVFNELTASTAPPGAGDPVDQLPRFVSQKFADLMLARFGPNALDPGTPTTAMEMSYSYDAAADTWQGHPQADAMRMALRGLLPLHALHQCVARIRQLTTALLLLLAKAQPGAATNDKRKKTQVKRRVFFEAIAKLWPTMSDGDTLRLRAVVNMEIDRLGVETRDNVPFETLLEEAPTAVLSPVTAALARVHLSEWRQFIVDVSEVLVRRAHTGVVRPPDLVAALKATDAQLPQSHITDVRSILFADETAATEGLPLAAVLEALPVVCCNRVGRRDGAVPNDGATPLPDVRKVEDASRKTLAQLRKGSFV